MSDPANPKDAIGSMKAPVSTVPWPIVFELGLAMLEGTLKYGRHNYRASGVRASIYVDACIRHLMSFWEGQDTDPDSGLPHLAKAMACCAILRDSQLMGNWVDDRPPVQPNGLDMARLNALAADICSRFPNPVEPWTQKRIEAEAKAVAKDAEQVLKQADEKYTTFAEKLRDELSGETL